MSLNKASLIRKLSTLSTSQDSIQSLSLWLFHFSKHADDIVKVWQQELKQAPTKQKLKFIFLANDVILQGRKKGMAYITAFQPVLPTVLPEVYKVLDAKGQQQLIRVISIWQDRAAYPVEFLNELRKRLRSSQPVASANSSGPAVSTDALQDVDLGQPINKRELFGKVDAHEEQFPSLTAAMAKIRSLPPAVFDDRPIKDITSVGDLAAAEAPVKQAQQDVTALLQSLRAFVAEGNILLQTAERCILQEKQAIARAQLKVEECKEQARRVTAVRKKLKEHVENLPDVHAPSVLTSEALPDPSDLFADDGDDAGPPPKQPKHGTGAASS